MSSIYAIYFIFVTRPSVKKPIFQKEKVAILTILHGSHDETENDLASAFVRNVSMKICFVALQTFKPSPNNSHQCYLSTGTRNAQQTTGISLTLLLFLSLCAISGGQQNKMPCNSRQNFNTTRGDRMEGGEGGGVRQVGEH